MQTSIAVPEAGRNTTQTKQVLSKKKPQKKPQNKYHPQYRALDKDLGARSLFGKLLQKAQWGNAGVRQGK